MSIGGSVALIVIGAILRFAVTWHSKYVDIKAIGVILMIGGAAGLVASIALVVYRRRSGYLPRWWSGVGIRSRPGDPDVRCRQAGPSGAGG